MAISRALQLLTLVGCGSAFVVRNNPPLNSTNVSAATAVEVFTVSVVTVTSNGQSTSKAKVHGESTADGWETTTTGNDKVRAEPTATDFDVARPTTMIGRQSKSSVEIIDIGTVLESLMSTTLAMPTVHWENSASGWEGAPPTVQYETSALAEVIPTSEAAHFESSADGWEKTRHEDLSAPQSTRYIPVEVSDDPWTRNVKPTRATGPARPQDNQAQSTTISSRVVTDFPPPPAITYDGVTIQPIAVTNRPTVTLPGGVLTTTDKVEFQVAIGSSTLTLGTPITINNVVVDITTDTVGSTVLRAGGFTTTLPKPTAGEVRTVVGDAPGRLSIMTAVVSGTTQYILAGQTLAPGHPVMIGDTPISIAVADDQTVLYVGDKTTTLAAADSDIQTITDWASISAGTQGTAAETSLESARPTNTGSGSPPLNVGAAFAYCAIGVVVFMVTS